ncbi:MAG: hypothetical protein AB4206_07825 [Xenococcaceae cyanobacterium]
MEIFDLEYKKLDLTVKQGVIIGGMLTETYSATGPTSSYAGTDAETGMAVAYADSMGMGDYTSVGSDTSSSANNYLTKSSARANSVAIFEESLYWSKSNSNSVNISTSFRNLYLGHSVSTGGFVSIIIA